MGSSNFKPPVSIVIPSFNQGHFIAETIDSILAQEIDNIEILVMDGGSQDETVDVLRGYGNLIQWVSERDRGQSHAINKGFSQARSDVLGYINSDDTYLPGALAAVLETICHHPEIDIVYGDFNFIDDTGCILKKCRTINFDYDILRYDYNFICQPASFWRRSVVERVGPITEELFYFMDYEFYLRSASAGMHFYHTRQTLANLRLHRGSKTMIGNFDSRRKYLAERSRVLASYSLHINQPFLNRALHLMFKAMFRCKAMGRHWLENREIDFRRTHQAMMQVNAK